MKSDEIDDSGGWQSAVDFSSPATVGMQPIGGVGVGGSPRLSPLGFLSPLDAGATKQLSHLLENQSSPSQIL